MTKNNTYLFINYILIVLCSFLIIPQSHAYIEYCKAKSNENKKLALHFEDLVDINLENHKESELLAIRSALGMSSNQGGLLGKFKKWKDKLFGKAGSNYGLNESTGLAVNRVLMKYGDKLKGKSDEEIIDLLNKETILMLDNFITLNETDNLHDSIDIKYAQAILDSKFNHQVVGDQAMHKYNQQGTEIGYCFGRAFYSEFILRMFGVHPSAIKDIWAVGPMGTDQLTWQFHVGNAVKLTDGRWVVIDTYAGRIMTVAQWHNRMKSESLDGRLRLYATDSEKFTPYLGEYSRLELGLDLNRKNDWYKGFFVDLLKWLNPKNEKRILDALNLDQFPARPNSKSVTETAESMGQKLPQELKSALTD